MEAAPLAELIVSLKMSVADSAGAGSAAALGEESCCRALGS
jgi:hypothetical protein